LKLTEKQRSALLYAYSDEYDITIDDGWGDGHSASTLRSLVKRGLLSAPGTDRDALECAELTRAGEQALGIRPQRTPKRASTALRRALRVFVPELDPGCITIGRRAPRVCVDESPWGNQYSDPSGVVGAVHHAATDEEDEDLIWTCVAKLASEMGHPMEASRVRHLVYFHPESND
jgi:hypothetical protein